MRTFCAGRLIAWPVELVPPTVTPTIATMYSENIMPAAPMRRSFLRPTRSIRLTPTTVMQVFTTSVMMVMMKALVIPAVLKKVVP